jgi:hypothetical protein
MGHPFRLSLALLIATPAAGQEAAPMSAIDWLSQSVESGTSAPTAPPVDEPPVTDSGAVPDIIVTPLDSPSPDPIGLLSPEVTGLPRTLWSASRESDLIDLIRAEQPHRLPALADLVTTLMLAQADPPLGAGPEGGLFLARVDRLLDQGALDPARALLDQADQDVPEVFRRWFDVSLLTGTEGAACMKLAARPVLSPTLAARIFCMAREDDWTTAVLTLGTARALGEVTPADDALLSRFLDPDLFEGAGPLPPPDRVSPLVFRLREAVGEGLSVAQLPLAFAHADLRDTAAWRNQMEAAERLAAAGALSENVLQRVYTDGVPAASGGIWDRARAVQELDTALAGTDDAELATRLTEAADAMQEAGLLVPFARLYAQDLVQRALPGPPGELAMTLGLLTAQYETAALAYAGSDPGLRFLASIARGQPAAPPAGAPPAQAAMAEAFGPAPQVPAALLDQLAQGRLGEVILRAAALIAAGVEGDPALVRDGIVTLRHVGMEDAARRIALQYLILGQPL